MFMNHNASWKEFVVGDFFSVELSSGDLKIDDCDSGTIPLVSSGQTNNGIVGYIDVKGDGVAQIFSGNKLTVDMFCNAYYQREDFYAVSHGRVNILTPLFDMNVQIGLFIATVINQESFKFSYGRAVYSNEIARMRIKLPAIIDKLGNATPDWECMENYIKLLHFKPLTTHNKKKCSIKFNIDIWKEFFVDDVFDMLNGKGITKEEIEENPGDFIAVQSGEENNGIIGKIDNNYCIEMNYTSTDEPCLTVARTGSAGFVSYQQFGCVVGDSAKILLLKNKEKRNSYVYLFIKTILMANKYKYTYGRKVTENKYLSEKIMLPTNVVNGQNTPNWYFMEKYIKSLPYGDRF